MAKKRSNVSTYPSRYGGGHVTIAQYITEYLCENIASKRKMELPPNFWENEDWAKFFKTQIVLLNRQVLTKYHPRAVVKALKDYRCQNVNSFGGFTKVKPWIAVLEEYDKKCKAEDEIQRNLKPHIVVDATKEKPQQKPGKTSILTKLRELDNGETKEGKQ